MNVVDSSGWIEYFAGNRAADFFAKAIEATSELVVPSITIHEVYRLIRNRRCEEDADVALGMMRRGLVIDLDPALAVRAARMSSALGLAMADSIILATATEYGATLWTQDAHFAGIKGVRYLAAR